MDKRIDRLISSSDLHNYTDRRSDRQTKRNSAAGVVPSFVSKDVEAEVDRVDRGDQCRWTGWNCITGCTDLPDGDYQSCRGCSIYVSCVGGKIVDNRSCAPSNPPLQWDDYLKKCEYNSRTCRCYRQSPKVGCDFLTINSIHAGCKKISIKWSQLRKIRGRKRKRKVQEVEEEDVEKEEKEKKRSRRGGRERGRVRVRVFSSFS